MSNDRDDKLLKLAMRGDDDALVELVFNLGTACEPKIQGSISERLRRTVAAEDICQMARATAIERFEQFSGSTFPEFRAWFTAIATNRLRDQEKNLMAKKREGSISRERDQTKLKQAIAREPNPEQVAHREEVVYSVKSNLDYLPTTQRQVIELTQFDSLSVSEAARQLDRPANQIRRLLARAKQSMKNSLGNTSKWFSRG